MTAAAQEPRTTAPTGRLSPASINLLIVLAITTGVLGIRHLGLLQFLEFQAYDLFIRNQARAATSEPLVLVELREADIQNPKLDWPIHDRELAALLSRIEQDGPAVIGLDIWRDLPVPRDGSQAQELAEVLQGYPNIIAIYTRGNTRGDIRGRIRPPPALQEHPDRLAFNDNVPPDIEVDSTIPKVRRTVLFETSADGLNLDSFPFRLAIGYLERRGIVAEPDPDNPGGFKLGKARPRAFQGNEGAYVKADSGGWQMLIDYRCPDEFTRLPVTQVLAGDFPAGTFHDKVVIIGVNTPSVADDRVTPTHRSHRGIELQALIVNQLVRQAVNGDQPLRTFPDWFEDLWVLAWCVAAGLIGHHIRSPWIAAPAALISVLGLFMITWGLFQAGWWLPLVAPAAAFVPAGALVTSHISFEEWRSREQLMQIFSRQVSPDIANALWEQRDQFLAGNRPRSHRLTATVLFTDLESFSSISERLDAAVLMDWLNQYMDAMATTIMEHEGVIEKYIGDAIMAVFGIPIPRNTEEGIREDARNAVRCALAMASTMERLNSTWQEAGLPKSGMRIGVHTGELIAGSLGSAERQEYTVIGDSVNTASRLESYDKSWSDPASPHPRCRVLISEATRRHLGDEFHITPVGTMLLKNKSEPVTLYSVIREPRPSSSTAA